MMGKNHDLICLLETLKDTTESQWAMILLICGLASKTSIAGSIRTADLVHKL